MATASLVDREVLKRREFNFTDKDFKCIRNLVSRFTGISLSEAKRDMVYSRLVKRVRQLELASFKDYCLLLQDREGRDEVVHFTNAITTNLTHFFREKHHFDYLSTDVIPHLLRSRSDQKRIRIWSAGCSTGEEPYSIAMVLHESIPNIHQWDVRVLATDIDSNVLATAREGIYTADRIETIAKVRQSKWFLRGKGSNQGYFRATQDLKDLIAFKQLNLMEAWPMHGLFDVIFCRNVVIYFTKDTQRVLVDRYADRTADDGFLFLGHSETLFKVSNRFDLLGQTIYRKVC